MSERIPNLKQKARKVRAIVESKENFVWPTFMEDLKILFKVPNLGRNLVNEMLGALEEQGIMCHSSGFPGWQEKPIILFLSNCRHSNCLASQEVGVTSGASDFDDYDEEDGEPDA